MDEARRDDALKAVKEIFGDRAERGPAGPGEEGALALVSPRSAGEVELLAEAAGRFSVPLAGLGPARLARPRFEREVSWFASTS